MEFSVGAGGTSDSEEWGGEGMTVERELNGKGKREAYEVSYVSVPLLYLYVGRKVMRASE